MKILHALRLASLVVLAIAAAVFVCRYADQHNRVFDVSRAARNTLDAKSVAVLALINEPIIVTAYVPNEPALRRAIGEFFERYRRHQPTLALHFVDPREELERARRDGARLGEIVLRAERRRERITRLSEYDATNALARLARGGERFVTFLAGNGERQPGRAANHDMSIFATRLEQRGLSLRSFAFGQADSIPANTVVLVIASPAQAYAAGDLALINDYVANGGNLLWLSEPDQPAELAALGRAIGVEHLPGTIVDPVGLTRFRNAAYAVTSAPEAHAALAGLDQTVVFPFAAALVPQPNVGWRASTLARTGHDAWTETGPFAGNVGFDADDEIQGALSVAIALTRGAEAAQRVVVIGDGDFLSNTFVENLGNFEFGRRVFEWLAHDDALIDLEVAEVADAALDLEMWQRLAIFMVFGVGIPLSLAANGMLYWWRRRRA